MEMNPAVTTIERGNINVLVWPVFGGMFGWVSLAPGVCMQVRGQDEETFKARTREGMNALWDLLDKQHEDDAERLHNYLTCWPHKEKPLKFIPVPAAPPYLDDAVLEKCLDQAYSE